MSRMKERYDQCGSTREAVAGGVASTARIITGAADHRGGVRRLRSRAAPAIRGDGLRRGGSPDPGCHADPFGHPPEHLELARSTHTPLTDTDADKLIRSIRSAPLLFGHRGTPRPTSQPCATSCSASRASPHGRKKESKAFPNGPWFLSPSIVFMTADARTRPRDGPPSAAAGPSRHRGPDLRDSSGWGVWRDCSRRLTLPVPGHRVVPSSRRSWEVVMGGSCRRPAAGRRTCRRWTGAARSRCMQ